MGPHRVRRGVVVGVAALGVGDPNPGVAKSLDLVLETGERRSFGEAEEVDVKTAVRSAWFGSSASSTAVMMRSIPGVVR